MNANWYRSGWNENGSYRAERSREQLYRHRLPTPRDYQQTIENIAHLVALAEEATGQTGTVGMGIPGSISPYTGW